MRPWLPGQSEPMPHPQPAGNHDDCGPCLETMDTEFVNPVIYSLSDRATKYGALFVILFLFGLFGSHEKAARSPFSICWSARPVLDQPVRRLGFATASAIAASACVALLAFTPSPFWNGIRAPAVRDCHRGPTACCMCCCSWSRPLVVGSIRPAWRAGLVQDWYAFDRQRWRSAQQVFGTKRRPHEPGHGTHQQAQALLNTFCRAICLASLAKLSCSSDFQQALAERCKARRPQALQVPRQQVVAAGRQLQTTASATLRPGPVAGSWMGLRCSMLMPQIALSGTSAIKR